MRGEALQGVARQRAQSLPASELYSFAPGWVAARVREKWFMLLTDVPSGSRVEALAGQPIVVVKADPSDAVSLREAYADITDGYHMNKRHWITLVPGNSLDEPFVRELVTDSYRLAREALPASRRPEMPE